MDSIASQTYDIHSFSPRAYGDFHLRRIGNALPSHYTGNIADRDLSSHRSRNIERAACRIRIYRDFLQLGRGNASFLSSSEHTGKDALTRILVVGILVDGELRAIACDGDFKP